MSLLLPSSRSSNHTSVRRRLARTADRLQARDDVSPHRMSLAHGSPLVVSIDGAHIRAVPGFQTQHFEVTTGRVEAQGRPARHFAVAPNVPASWPSIILNALRAQGWLPGREVIVLSDGDPSLVGAARSAVRGPVTHILDWFHISMRVRHIEQALVLLDILLSECRRVLPMATWTAAGIGRYQAAVMQWALKRGADAVRTGLEDNIRVTKDRLARSNAELVQLAAETIGRHGGRPATPAEARAALGLSPRTKAYLELTDGFRTTSDNIT